MSAQEYVEQGNTLLWQGQLREAATAFAHAAQSDPNLIGAHLGLAQTSLAMGSYGMVHMACRRVQELEPSGPNASLAQALVFLLDRRYDRALEAVERTIAADPGRAYALALRSYLLRQMNREYEAALAEAKSERLAGPTDFKVLFPKVTPPTQPTPINTAREEREPERSEPVWQPPSQVQRRVVRARFATRGVPIVTLTLIGINVLVYLACVVLSQNLTEPYSPDNPIYYYGVEAGIFITQNHEYWRLLTAMFLHENWLHIGVNMLSLYFIGPFAENVYGRWRFLLIYLATGVFGGILVLLLAAPNVATLGASGAIFGVFGALGIFFWEKRYALGPGMLTQWLFWLILNLVFTFQIANISVSGHIGGLSMGLLLGLLLMPDFWRPVQTRLKRGQTGEAVIYILKPLLLVLVVCAGLIFLAIYLGGGR
ncbi:MAG TPA: rhomboid family intramembrane serine protease [Ktedonobacterales bacterium]